MAKILSPNGENERVCKPYRQVDMRPDAAVKIDINRGKIAEERRKKLEEAKNRPDQEYIELFETVTKLIVTPDFWELPPDNSIIMVYGFIMAEVKRRGLKLPKLPDDLEDIKKNNNPNIEALKLPKEE